MSSVIASSLMSSTKSALFANRDASRFLSSLIAASPPATIASAYVLRRSSLTSSRHIIGASGSRHRSPAYSSSAFIAALHVLESPVLSTACLAHIVNSSTSQVTTPGASEMTWDVFTETNGSSVKP